MRKLFFGLLYACVVLSCFAGCGSSRLDLVAHVKAYSDHLQPLVDALEAYHVKHKRYPPSLNELNSTVAPFTPAQGQKKLEPFGPHYEISRDGSFFRMSIGVVESQDTLVGAYYFSPERKWIFVTSKPVLSHVEAQYYGQFFAETGGSKYLDLAVSSLVDAAKQRGSNECRRLWMEWVRGSLGEGEATRISLPSSPLQEARVYSSKDAQLSYAFSVTEIIDPDLRNTPVVSAVYKRVGAGREWLLHQVCDA